MCEVHPLACPSGVPLRGLEPDHGGPCTEESKVSERALLVEGIIMLRVPGTDLTPYLGGWPIHDGEATPDRDVGRFLARQARPVFPTGHSVPFWVPKVVPTVASHSTMGSLFAVHEGFNEATQTNRSFMRAVSYTYCVHLRFLSRIAGIQSPPRPPSSSSYSTLHGGRVGSGGPFPPKHQYLVGYRLPHVILW